MKCLYSARIGRPDILWSENKLARAVTKWIRAGDRRLARLISDIHHTSEFKQYGHVGNTAQQCRLVLFQDSDFAGDLETQNRPQGEFHAYVEVTRLFPLVGCVRNKLLFHTVQQKLKLFLLMQVYAWMEFPLFDLWDLVIEVLHSSSNQYKKSKENVQGNLPHDTPSRKQTKNQAQTPTQYNGLELCNVDYVSSNVKSSQSGAMHYIFEECEAVIKMIIKGRSPTMRHVSRTHRVALDWLFDRINLDPKIQIKYVDTKNLLADILTKGSFHP